MLCVSCEQTIRTRRSIDEPILVKSKAEVAALPTTQSYKFICIRCGKETVIKSAGKRASEWFSGFCLPCLTSIRNKRHTDDYIEITDPRQFDGMVRHQKFIITCKKCGKRQKHELFMRDCLPTYLKFLCTTCAHADHMTGNQNGYKEETHVPILITDPKQFDTMVSKRPYEYNCRNCGVLCKVKQYDPRKIEYNKQMLCNTCARARFIYDHVSFDSSWEIAVWIYAKDNDIPIEREPIRYFFNLPGGALNVYSVIPDFRYNGKIIEIKGPQYFKNGDYNNRMIFPYRRLGRHTELLTEWQKEFMNDLYEAKHQCELRNGVEIWGKEECKPFLDYIDATYGPGYLLQFRVR